MATDPLAPRTVRPARREYERAPAPVHHVFRLFDDLIGPMGSGDRFGSDLAIDDIRWAEAMAGVPLAERLPGQPREEI